MSLKKRNEEFFNSQATEKKEGKKYNCALKRYTQIRKNFPCRKGVVNKCIVCLLEIKIKLTI